MPNTPRDREKPFASNKVSEIGMLNICTFPCDENSQWGRY